MPRKLGYLVGAIMIALLPQPGVAAEAEAGRVPPAVAKLSQCKALKDDAARLACFDRETDVLIAAVDQGEVKVVDREQAKTMRRSLFGFNLPKLGLFGGGNNDASNEDIAVLDSTITSLSALPRGRWQFSIAEGGAHWETTDAPSRLVTPKVGQKVQLERAALGSYWIRFNGQRGVKGRRVN
jgi:hypothetical protein